MKFAASIIMSMAQAAAEFADAERGLLLDQSSCLHSRDIFSTCTICVDSCPITALSMNKSETVTEIDVAETCANCGLCTRLCPVGAFSGGDAGAELLATVSQHEKRNIVELACAHHPAAEKGPPQSDLVVRTQSCLAALGPSALVSLLALGVYHVLLRVDACHTCPLGQAQGAISKCAAQTEALLAGANGRGSPLTLLDNIKEEWPSRPVVTGKAPTRSRRDFFRSFMGPQELPAVTRRLMLEEVPQAEKQPPAERRRLLLALEALPVDLLSPEPLQASGMAMISAGDGCTACRICERACPTAAMQFEVDEDDHYALTFSAGACTNCGACIDLCEPGVLQRERPPALNDWLGGPQILRSGTLKRCARCSAGFAGESPSGLCPVCDFRRQNPFGSRLPPGFDGQR